MKKSKKSVVAEVRKLVKQGRGIEAIRVYREGAGCGLAESVEFVRKVREEYESKKR